MRPRLVREDGQVLPLLAAGLLVVLLGFTAFAVDLGHVYLVKRQLQSTADAAALAAATDLPSVAKAADTARAFGPADKNPVPGLSVAQTVTPWCLKSIAFCYGNSPNSAPSNGQATGVVVSESTNVPTTFAKLFGIDTINVTAKSTACGGCAAQPLDIALVVDRTGSMYGQMQNLKDGIKTFLQALDPRFHYVTLMVLPPLAGRGSCSTALNGDWPYAGGYSFPLGSDDTYTVTRMSHDYADGRGALNQGSPLVQAVNCLQAAGSTSYTQALEQAQSELLNHGSGRKNVQRVIVFESDGASNAAPESAYDRSLPSADYNGRTVYQPSAARADEVTRPCGSAVDAADGIRQSGTLIFSVGYAVSQWETCYEAPHAYSVRTGRKRTQMRSVGYQDEQEGVAALDALTHIAGPGGYVNQADAGDMSATFRKVADKLMGARLVADSEAN